MASYPIVQGTTADLQFQLLEDGEPINLLNVQVELILEDRLGATVASPGSVVVVDEAEGIVQLTPANANVFDPARSPYSARWKLTGGGGKVSYVPSSDRDQWHIFKT